MYNELFNEVFLDNENTICIFEIGAFYIILNEQATYLSELLGLKKVCFAPGICKVGFPKGSLTKYVKKLRNLSISFVVLDACNMDSSADYIYELKGFKKKYEFVDERFIFNKYNYICDCNKCSFKKTEIMRELDKCRRNIAMLANKISTLSIIGDNKIKCDFKANEKEYEELMIWGNLDEQ
ncbi:MAG: hypothetical protein IJ272_08910 [Clostridia bacterium]|nr:hypothetical protein [Clostridia bacterium]